MTIIITFNFPCHLLTPSQGASSSVRVTDTTLTHLKLWLQTKRMELGLFRAVVAGSVPARRPALEAVARYQGLNTTQALAAVLREFRAKNIDFGSEKMMTSLMTLLLEEIPLRKKLKSSTIVAEMKEQLCLVFTPRTKLSTIL